MRIAITGATGLLGRNILAEFVKRSYHEPFDFEVVVLGRNQGGVELSQRIRDILFSDGLDYLGNGANTAKYSAYLNDLLAHRVHCVQYDADSQLDSDTSLPIRGPFDFFFHSAALVDFRDQPNIAEDLHRTNVLGTKRIIGIVSKLETRQFIYIGSAYCCGAATGLLAPDAVDLSRRFRNPYERTKLQGEILVREFAARSGTRCRYFRPSTISGRLIEPPIGATPKFDVFYSWAGFFLRAKVHALGDSTNKYAALWNCDCRIAYNPSSGLNIVPVDFAAKAIYEVCVGGHPGESYHLVNEAHTPHSTYIPLMLSQLGIVGTSVVPEQPPNLNEFEKLYYRHVGKMYTPYITCGDMIFDTSGLRGLFDANVLSCPPVDHAGFTTLFDYAKRRDFGLVFKPSRRPRE